MTRRGGGRGAREPEPLYGVGGYKAWIGDACINAEGKRRLSDDRDHVIVVHGFSCDDDDEEEEKP